MTVHARKLLQIPDQPWADRAACRKPHVDPDWFHPVGDDTYAIAHALEICLSCPVISDCLEHALIAGENQGIWGGKTDKQRAAMSKKKRRANLKAVAAQQKEA